MRYRAKPGMCNTCPIKDTCAVSANADRNSPTKWTDKLLRDRAVFHRRTEWQCHWVNHPRGAAIVWRLPAGALVEVRLL